MTSPDAPGSPADKIRSLWELASKDRPQELATSLGEFPAAGQDERIEAVIIDAQERWDRGLSGSLEHYRALVPALAADPELVRALLMSECSHRRGAAIDALRK